MMRTQTEPYLEVDIVPGDEPSVVILELVLDPPPRVRTALGTMPPLPRAPSIADGVPVAVDDHS
jgi:hypothetical protein